MAGIAWTPHPRQAMALERSEFEVLYGGARGGGKTDAGFAWLVDPVYIRSPRYQGLVVRRNADDLSDWIGRARVFFRPVGGRIAGNPPVIKLPSGARIKTGHLKDAGAYEKYQGHEYQKILIEELTQIPKQDYYEKLISSARSTISGLPAQVFATTNPGGPGHVWVKARWVSVARWKTYIDPVSGSSRIFIPSKVDDNPTILTADPMYVRRLEGISDPKLRAAWRNGSWDVFSGQFFDMWDPAVHVVKPFRLSPQWARYRGLDWGYTAPAAVVWIAVDFEGNHYLYREYYRAGQAPGQMARNVLGMSPRDEEIAATYADPSIWAKDQYGKGEAKEQFTTKSIHDLFVEEGFYCQKANNDRPSGWNNLRELLSWDANRKPRLFVFEDCKETLRTMPGLVHDENNIEDVDTDGDDHIPDALRYILLHTARAHRATNQKTEMQQMFDRLHAGTDEGGEWDNL